MRTEKNEWRHLGPNSMATNAHPTMGGIIDHVATTTNNWFVIFNNEFLPNSVHNFTTKADAFTFFNNVMKAMGLAE